MGETVISVQNLTKKYVIGKQQSGNSFREMLAGKSKAIAERILSTRQQSTEVSEPSSEEFLALDDISFSINRGETVGIIGSNGAGKSTLLKILSRITEPTSGRVSVKGRVASLLEVGTGFHPELTGRENVFLNGAVLGMSEAEIRRKFDEIVAFAEVEKFINLPVKKYSSGMYVRLAFAVAANLDPDILILDEVLAVGDIKFQKKCMNKIYEAGQDGKTILVVSHEMGNVTRTCKRVIWLVKGQIHLDGEAGEISNEYLGVAFRVVSSGEVTIERKSELPEQDLYFNTVSILDEDNNPTSTLDVLRPAKIRITYEAKKDIEGLDLSLRIFNVVDVPIFTVERSSSEGLGIKKGSYVSEIEIPPEFLVPGVYTLNIGAHIPNVKILDNHRSVISFEVLETGSKAAIYKGSEYGVVFVNLDWKELDYTPVLT